MLPPVSLISFFLFIYILLDMIFSTLDLEVDGSAAAIYIFAIWPSRRYRHMSECNMLQMIRT